MSAEASPAAGPLHGSGRALIVCGAVLFLLSLINGFVIQTVPLPRLALSAHVLGLIGSSLLIGLGSVWARLRLAPRTSRIGAMLAVYGFGGGWVLYFTAAATRTGGMFPMASGNTHGTDVAESIVSLGMMTIALALFSLAGVVLSGLRKR